MIQTVLVVGATGNVGKRVVKLLSEKNVKVLAGTRNPEAYNFKNQNVKPIKLDFADKTTYAPAVNEADAIFLMSRPLDPDALENLSPLIDLAKGKKMNRIVFLSAIGVEHSDTAPLRQVEKYIEKSGVPYTILRPNFFMDNFYPGFIYQSIKTQGAFYLPAGDAKTSFISTDDIAAAAAVALTSDGHTGKAYTLTGTDSLNHNEVAKIISEVSEKDIKYFAISDEDLRKTLSGFGMPQYEVDYMSNLYSSVRGGYVGHIDPIIESLIGRKPIFFKNFVQSNAEYFK